jgi:hypothetical protein
MGRSRAPLRRKNRLSDVDPKLVALIATATLLSLGHTADHAIRDDLRGPSKELFLFLLVNLIIYGSVASGLYLYAKGKAGPRFWTIFALVGVLFGWASHFSPFTVQNPSYILRAYNYGVGGWLALGVLSALMLVMMAVGVYAAFLWRRQAKADAARSH